MLIKLLSCETKQTLVCLLRKKPQMLVVSPKESHYMYL